MSKEEAKTAANAVKHCMGNITMSVTDATVRNTLSSGAAARLGYDAPLKSSVETHRDLKSFACVAAVACKVPLTAIGQEGVNEYLWAHSFPKATRKQIKVDTDSQVKSLAILTSPFGKDPVGMADALCAAASLADDLCKKMGITDGCGLGGHSMTNFQTVLAAGTAQLKCSDNVPKPIRDALKTVLGPAFEYEKAQSVDEADDGGGAAKPKAAEAAAAAAAKPLQKKAEAASSSA